METAFRKTQNIASRIFNSRYYLPAMLALALFGIAFDAAFLCLCIYLLLCEFMLIFCDDLMSIFAPVIFTLETAVQYYKDLTVLTQYMWYAIVPVSLALIFNIIYYRRPFTKGRYTYSYLAVSLALILGGIGVIPAHEYFEPMGLYYTLALGIGQFILYMLFRSRITNCRDYDRIERVAETLYAAGLVFVIVIFGIYIENFAKFIEKGGVLFIKSRNYMTSVLLMSLPMTCILVKRSDLYLIGGALMYAAMLLSGSRSGLLFGTVLLVLCAVYIYITNKKSRRLYNWLFGIAAVAGCVLAAVYLPKLYGARFDGGKVGDKTRVEFIKRGIANFLAHPAFGIGVANTKDLSIFKAFIPGCITFYHNIVIQIMSSTGLAGIAAFAWQFILRAGDLLKNRKNRAFVFALSYLGILMMSFTNPGIFCPFPEAGLLTLIFTVVENNTLDEGNNMEEEK